MKAAARNEFFKGAGELATEALQTLPDDAPLPNVRTLERVANCVRENLRPKHPMDLNFQVNPGFSIKNSSIHNLISSIFYSLITNLVQDVMCIALNLSVCYSWKRPTSPQAFSVETSATMASAILSSHLTYTSTV